MIAQSDFTPAALATQIKVIASDPQALANAAGRALSIGRPHATRDLANLVERIANRLSPIAVGPVTSKPAAKAFTVGAPA
jgi:UDP-N-acetylglucosamine--N-acetylmuramyl-(pentapeptide) pyrophosphoryl-undecaprenol N-acetylglucosamine transferase